MLVKQPLDSVAMTDPPRPRSPLWMVVLALACEEPMHPYRMQTLIKQRGKDQVANVAQRNSVYQTIDALMRAGLIRVRETTQEENRPERTIYEATERGREVLLDWLRAGSGVPGLPGGPFHHGSPVEARDPRSPRGARRGAGGAAARAREDLAGPAA